jgi:thioredoxin-related protein
MKSLLTLLLASITFTSPQWLTHIDQAKTTAKQEHKNILLNFSGSDWCGPCIRLHKEIFNADDFSSYASENLVLVNADFPRLKKNQLSKEQTKENETLADRYNPEGKFPFTVLLDNEGKVLKTWEGFPNESSSQFIGEVKSIAIGH